MKKVLLLLDHAPDYRESFLRGLSEFYALTVVAHPCGRDRLNPPADRVGYKYVELHETWGDKVRFNFDLPRLISEIDPDVICVALNPRFPFRLINFLSSGSNKGKWIWWGQIFGRTRNYFLDKGRMFLLKRAFGALVYTEEIAHKLRGINVISFDNSQYSESDFQKLENVFGDSINLLFVGRPQKRKKLEVLTQVARQYPNLEIRLVGPGMLKYFQDHDIPSNIKLFEGAQGDELVDHFRWSNLVVNPGHVGLLVMNAACHCRPIVINSEVNHAPEVILAKEAAQFFLNFNKQEDVDAFFSQIIYNQSLIRQKGVDLFTKCINKYTVEKMVEKHRILFDQV